MIFCCTAQDLALALLLDNLIAMPSVNCDFLGSYFRLKCAFLCGRKVVADYKHHQNCSNTHVCALEA